MLLKIEKKGGGLPLLAAACRVFQHPLERALNRRARNARAQGILEDYLFKSPSCSG